MVVAGSGGDGEIVGGRHGDGDGELRLAVEPHPGARLAAAALVLVRPLVEEGPQRLRLGGVLRRRLVEPEVGAQQEAVLLLLPPLLLLVVLLAEIDGVRRAVAVVVPVVAVEEDGSVVVVVVLVGRLHAQLLELPLAVV